jgi:hypothetical protein
MIENQSKRLKSAVHGRGCNGTAVVRILALLAEPRLSELFNCLRGDRVQPLTAKESLQCVAVHFVGAVGLWTVPTCGPFKKSLDGIIESHWRGLTTDTSVAFRQISLALGFELFGFVLVTAVR